jgi:hypothetical protein
MKIVPLLDEPAAAPEKLAIVAVENPTVPAR